MPSPERTGQERVVCVLRGRETAVQFTALLPQTQHWELGQATARNLELLSGFYMGGRDPNT